MNTGSLLSGANLLELSPDHVDEGNRIGFLHQDKAAALGRLMAVDGQRDPIKVVAQPGNAEKPWRLVTGMHRLIGARIECITVFAIEVSGKPEDLADLEASENLHRRPLAPLERAKFTAALVMAAQARIARQRGGLKQQQLAIKARWDAVRKGEMRTEQALKDEAEDTVSQFATAYDWEESVGEALGMARAAIYRDLRLFRMIIEPFPDLCEPLSKHPVVGENASQLKAIADIKEHGHRQQVIEQLLADSELSADEARVQVGIDKASSAPVHGYQKHYDAITGGWGRLGLTEQNRFVREELPNLLSDGQKRVLRDRLNEELGDAG